jgi:oligoribonuclease NrnB/cAMP/cGMP phosphodiesterase (DHH superfamily)
MDGVASAFITDAALPKDTERELLPIQYGEEEKLFDKLRQLDYDVSVIMVDFSFKQKEMSDLLFTSVEVTVIDHHATAWQELEPLIQEPNFTFHFNNEKSGATLTFEIFKAKHGLRNGLFNYIEDRDLWKWKLAYSKEISEYLSLIVKPNDIESFKEAYELFNKDTKTFVKNGQTLLLKKQQSVNAKVKKAQEVTIKNTSFMLINATENVSELGNEIAKHFNKPACIFFFAENFKVVLSFRSTDELPSVSDIAKQFPGGGGHRNAAGCTITLDELSNIIGTKRK